MVVPKTSFDPGDFIAPSTIARLLVVSYFIALALNLISGADIKLLAAPFLSETVAHLTMRSIVLVLSAMVLFGAYRRPAALILALVIFWPSYMSMYAGNDISAFWRDLALIGALLMTSYDKHGAEVATDDDHGSEDHTLDLAADAPEDAPATAPYNDEIYREDLNLVRSV